MAKKTITMQSLSQEDDLVFLDEQLETTISWEFINQSDADSDTESLLSLEDGFVSWHTLPKSPILNQEIETQVMIQDQNVIDDVDSGDDRVNFYGYYQTGSIIDDDDDDVVDDDDEEKDEDDGDGYGYGYGYGLDDELVPWNVSGKLGRQRMRKLGKRVFSKMSNSKRNPYLHVKPGAVQGKHGLGLKA